VDANLVVDADPQLLTSAVMNLLLNAFKNTPPNGTVTLRARAEEQRLVIDIEDQCGGIPDSQG
jgi:signal transduction histidine kinase